MKKYRDVKQSQLPLVKSTIPAKLFAAGEDIVGNEPTEQDKAFLTKYLIQVTLPHSNPGNVPVFKRMNGDVSLTIQPALDEQNDYKPLYPYGSVPRLLLYWITREALRQQSRRLELSDSINGFLRDLGMNPITGGGKRGDVRRLRTQMERLFRARISLDAILRDGERTGQAWCDMQIAPEGVTWWDYQHPDQGGLFESWILLGENFYNAILTDPIPHDLRAVAALKRSPLALDLYAWVAYESFKALQKGKGRKVPWRGLMQQFGSEYADYQNFRRAAVAALKRIKIVYSNMHVEEVRGGIFIHPALPPIAVKE